MSFTAIPNPELLTDRLDSDNILASPRSHTTNSINLEVQSFGHYFKPYRPFSSLYTTPFSSFLVHRQPLMYSSVYSSAFMIHEAASQVRAYRYTALSHDMLLNEGKLIKFNTVG